MCRNSWRVFKAYRMKSSYLELMLFRTEDTSTADVVGCCRPALVTYSLVNQTTFLRMALIDYKRPLGKSLKHFYSIVCSTDIQILYIDWY